MSEMKVSMEEKKAEAIRRMKLMGIYEETINQFAEQGLVSLSEAPLGAFYWANEEEKKQIAEFEKEYNALVYLGTRCTFGGLGRMSNYLFVSDHKEEWEMDDEGIKNGEALSYVYNQDAPDCSEIGYIGIKLLPFSGSIARTW